MKIKSLIIAFLLSALFIQAQEIVELKTTASNLIVIKLQFKNGSISDPKGKEGLTELTASLITDGGTKDLSSTQIKDKMYPWAAQFGSSVDKEVSVFTFIVHRDFLDKFYEIVKGLMLTHSFSEEDFNRVKSNQQNYVDQVIRSSSDEEYSKKELENFLFRGTNYQHMVEGNSEGVKSITLDDVKNHYKNYFTRHNLMIGIAGDYSPDFLTMLKNDMMTLSDAKPVLTAAGKAAMPDGINVEIVAKDNALGSAIFAGFPLDITRTNDEFAALMVANSWLGEHRKSYSRLYQKIREARSMNYGDYTYIEWYDNGGQNMLPVTGVPRSSNYFGIWIRPVQTAKGLLNQYPELKGIKIGHAHFALRMAIREMDLLVTNGMKKEDFELTRTFLRSYCKLYAQTPQKQLGFLMDSKFYGRKNYLTELDALLEKVTLDDVNNAMKRFWQTKNMCVTIVTDKTEAEPLANSLKENTPSSMSYQNTLKSALPPDVFEEDKLVENYPLNIKRVTIIKSVDTFK